MSTSAVLPVSAAASVDYNSASASTAQQAVFNGVLNQLKQSVAAGDLPSSQTLLNAVSEISPSASLGNSPLSTFLSSLSTAISNNSVSGAQSALATYQQSASGSSSTPAFTADEAAEAVQITVKVAKNASQLFVNTHPKPSTAFNNQQESSAVQRQVSNLINILNAAYPSSSIASPATSAAGHTTANAISPQGAVIAASGATAAAAPNPANAATAAQPTNASLSTSAPSTPYDTLVSSIQASLGGGNGTLTPALAYLQAAGNFINTSV